MHFQVKSVTTEKVHRKNIKIGCFKKLSTGIHFYLLNFRLKDIIMTHCLTLTKYEQTIIMVGKESWKYRMSWQSFLILYHV